jgi:ribosomal protein L11 methyltransferase
VGCGTAILSLLAKGMGAGLVWGCDNDPSAVSRARETVEGNGNPPINLFVSDLLAQVPETAPFDLVVANIISDILVRLLKDDRLLSLMAPGGKIILSGIHTEGKAEVAEALTRRGLTHEHWISEEGWWAVVAEK